MYMYKKSREKRTGDTACMKINMVFGHANASKE
jgi:hypothetical protein